MMTIYLKIEEDHIKDIKFQTFGCGAAIAVSSMLTEIAKGKSLEEAKQITNKDVANALEGLPKNKLHCSNLGADALQMAIKDYEDRPGKPVTKDAGEEPSEQSHSDKCYCPYCDTEIPEGNTFCKGVRWKYRGSVSLGGNRLMKIINLDHISASPVLPEVQEAMIEAIKMNYGNPSSQHKIGDKAAGSQTARESVARLINSAIPKEVVFTSGGTESVNQAIKGVAFAHSKKATILLHPILNTMSFSAASVG